MKKRIISLIAVISLVTSAANFTIAFAENDGKQIVYVSPDGSDSNPGTKERPLKTLDGAKNKVAQLMLTSKNGIDVVFRQGEYRFSSTAEFDEANSGTAENPIVYKAYDNEKVEFKGSVEIDASKGKRVTDQNILSRMYESVWNKVVCFDLTELGIKSAMIRQAANVDTSWPLNNGEMNGVYVDDTSMTLSQWPNGEATYVRWENAVGPHTIEYTDNAPNRWGKAKDFWLGGYPTFDYYYVRSGVTEVNTAEKTISIYSNTSSHTFSSFQARRWKAFNLLEEIDFPGEYYIDPESMMLYIYPPYSLENARMEIAWLNTPLISITNASNITFEGITFSQTRGNAISMMYVDNIDIIGCTFENIQGYGVYARGQNNARTDKDYWQVQDIDVSYNCDIKESIFNNIGSSAIYMSGGNVDTLKKSNNVIADNMIYRANYLAKYMMAIQLFGCGTTIVNNNISKCPGIGIRFYGNDHTIMYNEIHDVIQEADDSGAIYTGRNSIQRGTEIAYNYLHDLKSTEKLPFGFQSGIYWDDNHTGINAHHNIIKNSRVDLASNGSVDCNFSENISVDIEAKKWHYINGGYSVNHNGGETATNYEFGSYIANPELYYERYPTLKQLFSYKSLDPELAKFNKLKNNLSVNSCEATTGTNTLKYSDVTGNLELEECNDFVDPEREDYRIKANSETAQKVKGILTDEFDIEQIGLLHNVTLNKETAPFRQLYPQNGEQAVQSSSVEFVWENAFGATKYNLVIATDPDLKNVVYDEIVPYNLVKVEGLKNNTVYYWKVTAQNRSRDLFCDWESTSCVYSFKTGKYDVIDTVFLNEEIKKAQENIINLNEGDEIGQYPKGTAARIHSMIKRANILKNSKLGIVSQKSVDSMAATLSKSLRKIGMVNKGFLDITEYIDEDSEWGGSGTREGGAITVQGVASGASQGGTKTLANTTGSCLYSFDAKLNTDNWAIIAFSKFIDMVPYSAANNGYYICVKDDLVELQIATGTSASVVETIYKSFANDGQYHHLEFGFVNVGIGNIIGLYVDKEPWIEYLDVINPSVNTNCELSAFVVANDNDSISIRPSKEISSQEEFDDFVLRNLNRAAKAVLDSFETEDEIALFKNGSTKIIAPNGIFDVSYAPNKYINGKLMMAFDKVDEVFGVQTLEEDGKFFVVGDTKRQITNIGEQNGYAMVSVEEILDILGKSSTKSDAHDMLVSGTIIYMNNVSYLNKSSELMEMLEDNKSDFLFEKESGK